MNNPFVNSNDPTSAANRYPSLSSPPIDPNAQYSQWPNNGGGYGQQQSQPSYSPYPQQQQQPGYTMNAPQYAPSSPSGFQPTSSFGQQMAASMSGSSYGYLTGQPTGLPQQQPQSLGPAQAQISNNPGYVAQFDPYGPLSQWDGTSGQNQQQQQQYQQQQQPQQQHPTTSAATGVSPTGDPHPRDYLRSNKAQIEAWNGPTWNQFFTTFDTLGAAWNARKITAGTQAEQLKAQLPFAGYYQQQYQAEIARIQQLQKEADEQSDSVTASKFQLQEVFQSYRQSSDRAGKQMVREATNAAMNNLPPWPPANV
ncbi:hypothetical protein FA13DRAFT_1627018 [Coprinellus micaceus]|uniref:Uncharacterized protein n=1 Tax=Coprinellus micaceus TaxID=71717 RepID=A0A4Y7TIQ0_COPMI|nr:hypothetical protein FA13DRAFT_1627018 [Coprinellus micaceus]